MTRRTLAFLAIGAAFGLVANMLLLIHENRSLKAIASASFRRSIASIAPGESMPAVVVRTLQGKSQTVGGVPPGGHAGVVAFLTTTCQGCENSLKAWEDLAVRAGEYGLEFRGIGFGPLNLVSRYQVDHDLQFPLLWAGEGNIGRFRIESVPTTLLYDAEGQVTGIWRGTFEPANARELLEQAQRATRPAQ
jgi:hypothetical protein